MADDKTAPKAAAKPADEAKKTDATAPKTADTSTGKAETADAPTGASPGPGETLAKANTPADADRNAELEKLGVDPRLDNRLGDQRPELVEWPAKPQQIDGPEITDDWSKHAREVREEAAKFKGEDFKPAGAKSEGPHGLGPHGVTVGDDHGKPLTK